MTLRLRLLPGSLISVFPLGTGPWDAGSSGLKWPLKGYGWNRGSFGVSNVAPSGDFVVQALEGRFMVITPLGDSPANPEQR
jgi:thiamine pyrophosphokinase